MHPQKHHPQKKHQQKQNPERKKAPSLTVTGFVGKQGLTPAVIAELTSQLKKHKLIKVKVLKGFFEAESLNKKEAFRILAEKTGSKIVHAIGFTVVLHKHR